jgi:putative membrane protein
LALLVFTVIAVLGYGVFALNPGRIPDSDFARSLYGVSFRLFARTHIVVSALVLGVALIRNTGFRWVTAFGAIFLASFLSEFIGTGYGIPFGGYEYTSLLGFKLGGRVPAVIPVSWFLMALPSWVIAHRFFPGRGNLWIRVFLGGYLLTAWDLVLDPAMSHLTPYWVWAESGPFYGMPWINLAGWMGTGAVLMLILEGLGTKNWVRGVSPEWMAAYYGAVLLMPAGMVAAAGLWWALGALAGALVPVALLVLFTDRSWTSQAALPLAQGGTE